MTYRDTPGMCSLCLKVELLAINTDVLGFVNVYSLLGKTIPLLRTHHA